MRWVGLCLLIAGCSRSTREIPPPRSGALLLQVHAWTAQTEERLQGTVVDIHLSVWRSGRREAVRELAPEAVSIREDGRPSDVESLSELTRIRGMDVVLILDFSHSMVQAKALDSMKLAAIEFCRHAVENKARVALFKFATQSVLVRAFTSDLGALEKAISDLASDSVLDRFTGLYDAVIDAAGQFPAGPDGPLDPARRRALVIFSDGADNHSRSNLEQAANELRSRNLICYAIGLGNVDGPALDTLAATGRVLRTTRPEELQRMFTEIADRLGSIFYIRYISPRLDGSAHRLEIGIRSGDDSGTVSFTYRAGERK